MEDVVNLSQTGDNKIFLAVPENMKYHNRNYGSKLKTWYNSSALASITKNTLENNIIHADWNLSFKSFDLNVTLH